MSDTARCLRLGFAGTPEFAVAALDALSRSRHSIQAVFTQPDRPAGRGRALKVSAVKRRAVELNLQVHQPENFKTPQVQDTLRALDLDAFIVVAYGSLLPPGALCIPRLGCFNIHASLLPRWRGAAPIERALLAGDTETGVTIMRMEAGLDTGPSLASCKIDIAPLDTAGLLHERLAALGGECIVRAVDALAAGQAFEVAQSRCGVTYAEKLTKAEALIDWRQSGPSILRQVRAFNPRPIAETRLDGAQLRVWDAELPAATQNSTPSSAAPGSVLAASGAGIDVACGHGTLRITRLQLAGRKPLTAAQFLTAHRLEGARFANP